jgi:membrane-associated phospholipid phosphatase
MCSLKTVASLSFVAAASLASTRAEAREPYPLKYDLRIDVPVTSVMALGLMTSELFKASIVSKSCHWCAVPTLDQSARNALVWRDTGSADTTSYVTAFALAPAAAFGLDVLAASNAKYTQGALLDALVIGEATLVAATLNQVTKFAVQRERPFVHALSAEARLTTGHPSDNNLSFFSGHTSIAFALATSAGTVAELRGYRMAPVVWATGLPLAFLSGYLRIAADRHYLSDVLTGMLIGSAAGVAVPLLFHSRQQAAQSPVIVASPGGSIPAPRTFEITGVW